MEDSPQTIELRRLAATQNPMKDIVGEDLITILLTMSQRLDRIEARKYVAVESRPSIADDPEYLSGKPPTHTVEGLGKPRKKGGR